MSVPAEIDVLHVDDEPDFAGLVADMLEQEDSRFTVETARSASAGVERLATDDFDCIVSDYQMPEQNGIAFLETIREEYPDLPFILFTGKGSEEVASDALSAGATDYLQKGSGTDQYELLATRITTAVRQYRAERELERQKALLAKSQDLANVGAWEYNPQEQEVHFTDMVYEIYGVGPEYDPAPEKDIQEFYHPDDRDTVRTAVEEALQSGTEYDIEVRITAGDGTDKWIRTRGTPQVEDGTVQCVRGTIQDITERKERERKLQRKSRAIEAAPIGVVLTDPSQEDNPLTYVNQRFLDTTGYDRSEVLGQNCRFLQGEETDPETTATVGEAIDSERDVSVEIRNYRKDGTPFWNHLEIAPVRDENGELINFVGFQRDVTERIEDKQSLEESRTRYRTLVENFPNGAVSLVDENLRYTTVGGTPIEDAEATPAELEGTQISEALPDELADMVLPHYTDALDGEPSVFEEDIGGRCYRFRFLPVRTDAGSVFAAMGVSQDVTEQKEWERVLEKRERVLRELHVASRDFYPPDSVDEVSEFMVEFLESTFGYTYVSVKWFDDEEGVLRPANQSVSDAHEFTGPGVVKPGDDPIWEAYRTGESHLLDGQQLDASIAPEVDQLLAVPLGDFGLVVVMLRDGERTFDDVDQDLIEVLATNAEAVLESLKQKEEQAALAKKVEAQEETVAELRGVVDTIQSIQQRIADSESHDALETSVCEELLEINRIDFAWVGHPQGSDIDLTPTAWAGKANGYHDSVLTDVDTTTLPAQQAATRREPYAVSRISGYVIDEHWAKEALSAQFQSALSVPLIYDDVLYGVLTVYSQTESAFGSIYENLIGDVASLLVTYSRILEQRHPDTTQEVTELEFQMTDRGYPIQRLATETASRIRYDTVAETTRDTTRVLVTVTKGDAGQVLELAKSTPSISKARRFGDTDTKQLSLTVEKPFLVSDISKHGGELVEALSDETGTRLRIKLPRTVSTRPLLDALTNRFREIDLVAQRQHIRGDEQQAGSLTERQYEILNAAYHGGYYEIPRKVTGQDLAAEFDISGPAVSKHLQSAHRKVCKQFLESNI